MLGWHSYGVELVGAIPNGLPPLTLPDLSLAQQLWPGAVGIALMSFTETIAAGRAFQANDEPVPRANVELLATGIANVGGALFGSMPGGGGTSQTAVNRMTGARTQMAGVVTASMTVVTMLLLAPLIGLMPQATLAAVVIVYSIGLIQPADFRDILSIRRTEFVWAIAAFAGVMLLGTLEGILVAIIVSVVALSQQTANPPVYVLGRKRGTNVFRPRSDEHPTDESFPGVLLLRLEGRLFFLNADTVAQKIRPLAAEAKPKIVVLDLSGVFDLEYSALKALIEAERRQRDAGVLFALAGLSPAVLETVRRSPLGETLGRERLFFNLEMAVRYIGEPRTNGETDMKHDDDDASGGGLEEEDEGEEVPGGTRAAARRTRQVAAVGRREGPQGLHRVRRARRGREGRHDQGDHRTGQPADLSRGRVAGADRAREEPDVRPALPAVPAGGGRNRDLRPQLVQPRRASNA